MSSSFASPGYAGPKSKLLKIAVSSIFCKPDAIPGAQPASKNQGRKTSLCQLTMHRTIGLTDYYRTISDGLS